MRSRESYRSSGIWLVGLVAVCLLFASPAFAAPHAPDWVTALASEPTPKLPNDPALVALYSEVSITVDASGRETSLHRIVFRILRPQGIEPASMRQIYFDQDTRVKHLRGWGVPADGKTVELKDRDAVEVSPFDFELFSDDRLLTLRVPGMHVGDLVAFEWEQQQRPQLLQNEWLFQQPYPVLDARYTLQLPAGWEYHTAWIHHADVVPSVSGGQTTWELRNIPAVDFEPAMPEWGAVAGRMGLTLIPAGGASGISSPGLTWQQVARWAYHLQASSIQPTPAIQQKVQELTAGKQTQLEKIQALAEFVQHQVRYVAVEIGIGGYQPHPAGTVFSNLYGDCKDKAALLSAMLRVIGVRSWLVIANADRGATSPKFPSPEEFNHAILAIQVPPDPAANGLFAVSNDATFGKLLFFDPTSELTSFGSLPAPEQGSDVLISDPDHGKLVRLPVLPPAANRLLRVGNFRLLPNGTLAGAVREVRWGEPALATRSSLLAETDAQRTLDLQKFLGHFLANFQLSGAKVEDDNPNVITAYGFVAPQYASQAGDLLLVRPCVIGDKADALKTDRPRQYPVSFPATSLQTDIFTITLPAGYSVDELPPPVDIDDGFAAYHSKVELAGTPAAPALKLTRTWEVKALSVPVTEFDKLNRLYGMIEHNQQQQVVLKQAAQQASAAPHPGGQ